LQNDPSQIAHVARLFRQVRNKRELPSLLGLEIVPEIASALLDLKLGLVSKTEELFKLTTRYMYSTELKHQFESRDAARKANVKKRKSLAEKRVSRGGIPRKEVTYSHMMEKAALEHFRLTCKEGHVYSMSVENCTTDRYRTAKRCCYINLLVQLAMLDSRASCADFVAS
jgi:hypothetical protein